MAVAADMDQKPPMTTPMDARPTMNGRYPGAKAIRAPEAPINAASPISKVRRFILPVTTDTERLVRTANSPEIAMPWPTNPSET